MKIAALSLLPLFAFTFFATPASAEPTQPANSGTLVMANPPQARIITSSDLLMQIEANHTTAIVAPQPTASTIELPPVQGQGARILKSSKDVADADRLAPAPEKETLVQRFGQFGLKW